MLQLSDREWAEFDIRAVFPEIRRGKRLKTADHIDGNIPYVSSSAMNNGVDAFIGNDGHIRKYENCITLANSGSVGTAFYHCYEFIASDHVTALQSSKLNKYSYLFIATMVSRLQGKYSFNREINDLRINREKVLLPIDDDGKPDYAFMEQYIREREKQLIAQYIEHIGAVTYTGGGITPLHEKEWKEFYIHEVAEILSGRDIYDDERIPGNTPYIGASAANNGICHFISNVNETLEGNCISINRNGSVGYAFFHPYKALYSNDCRKLRPKIMNEYISLFLTNQLTAQRGKYGYGYKMGTGRLKRQAIMLPVDSGGQPDWQYMEQYAKMLMAKLKLQYLQSKQAQ